MLKIGIILGTTREGRVSPQVGKWVLDKGKNAALDLTIVDLKDYDLPFLGTKETAGIEQFKKTIAALDGFIFVTGEYNHSIPAALKNALDLIRDEWANKVAGIVSYGSLGGARAAEHLRGILGELRIADVRSHTALSLFTDFENWSVCKPADLHLENLNTMFEQVEAWGEALKAVRNRQD
jgi:NAD(P)H-dependent FMN reductase